MVLEYFKQITKISRCSGNTKKMANFLVDFCNQNGYMTQTDNYGNILATSQNPQICLQAHYDMVCIGNNNIEILQKNGYLKAKNSTLGADNGIGIAMMMALMNKYKNLEFLFTNDEEIGLIGAMNLELSPKASKLINLDSEDENIYIGCAGGFDVEIQIPTKRTPYHGEVYSIKIENLPGGHSGVDIDKNHPNAIKEVSKLLKNDFSLLSIKGGERRNSIPMQCEALVVSPKKLNFPKKIQKGEIIQNSKLLINLLQTLPHGVLNYNYEFCVPNKSVNLALVNDTKIILSARANNQKLIDELKTKIKNILDPTKAQYIIIDEYPAWNPKKSTLSTQYQNISNKPLKVIHAGLEPAILGDFFQEMISIGPNIYEPHSLRERVEISSIHKTFAQLEAFIAKYYL